ncbi:carboxylesterase/lipase family protein [Leifsonia sp. YAF41]|uniref:carboxylesterase/lipase family protein n=1 Tax=Leifsonia sp. YAF41 TaxID=3233086 RepID=UPI003F9AD4A9
MQVETIGADAAPAVTITSGRIRGVRLAQIDRYWGVPYAAAPVGANRFAAPQPVAAHEGERDCRQMGATPPQLPYAGGMENYLSTVTVPGDEILNVNIWAPAATPAELPVSDATASAATAFEAATSDAAHPVIVWIHGGSLSRGSNAITAYDGTAFARDGVVFIGVNYRLGAEGFSVLDDADTNLGLADQVAALQWVRHNAAAFGGDPANVTVMGESAGAICIAALLAHPDASALFDRAIMQSGPPDSRPRKKSRLITDLMAKDLQIPANRAAFSAMSATRLLEAQKRVTAGTTPITGGPAYTLTLDSNLVPRNPGTALAAGAGRGIPLLIGTNTEEYRLWFIPTGLMQKVGWLHILVAMLKFRISPRTVSRYRRNRPGCSVGELFGALATDLLLRVPVNRLADARFAQPDGATTHVYEFAWRSPVADLGACHALELGFVFDTLASDDAQGMAGPTAPQQLATDMHDAWVRFAKTGDPGWPTWNSYRPVRVWDGTANPLAHSPREDERASWR